MKRRQPTRFTPIPKTDSVGYMVAGDRRKMMEAHLQAMQEEALLRSALLDVGKEMLQILRGLSKGGQAIQGQPEPQA